MRTQHSRRRAMRASDLAMEGAAMNHAGRRILFNPTPEVDSLAERVAGLQVYGVPRHEVRALLSDIRRALDLNGGEGEVYAALCGELSSSASAAGGSSRVESLTTRGVVDALGRPTRLLADARRGVIVDSDDLARARAAVLDAARSVPRKTLLAGFVERQLRARRFAEIVAACDEVDGTKAAA